MSIAGLRDLTRLTDSACSATLLLMALLSPLSLDSTACFSLASMRVLDKGASLVSGLARSLRVLWASWTSVVRVCLALVV